MWNSLFQLRCGPVLILWPLLLLSACGDGPEEAPTASELPNTFVINPSVEETIASNMELVGRLLPVESYVRMDFLPPDGVYEAPEAAGPPAKLVIGLPWIYNDQHAPLYLADALGYFAEEGLEVELKEGGPGRNPLALLIGESIDIAVSSSGNAVVRLVASRTGAEVMAIGAMNVGTGYCWLAMDEDTPASEYSNRALKPEDFYGAKIGIQEGAEMAMAYFLENFPYLEEHVSFSRSGFTPDALVAGSIDFYAAMYENQPRLIEGLGFNNWTAFRFSDYGLQDFANVHVVKRELAEDQGDLLRRYLRAVGRGVQLMLDEPEKAAAITKKYSTTTQLTEAQILRRFELQRSYVEAKPDRPILYTPLELWDRVASQLYTYDQIELALPE
jgi:ABC-type nitrate/sulfonate/bicarbonate transport system substrate-binding protein